MNENPISVLILADQVISREGLRTLLQFGGRVNVIGAVGHWEDALSLARASRADVVLMDYVLPICAVDATRKVLSALPSLHVIVLSAYADDPHVAEVIAGELRKAGASGLLPKNTPVPELIEALDRVILGHPVFHLPDSSERSPAHSSPLKSPPIRIVGPPLTLRQTQVLKLVAEGLANKEIADRLHISPKTVEKHRQSVKEKLQIHNAADLTRCAIGIGLVQPV